MYKLIALDMDGTLLRKDKTISDRTMKAIDAARKKGVKIVLATGRPAKGIQSYLNHLGLDSDEEYAVTFNGSAVQSAKDGQLLFEQYISGKDLHFLYNLSLELGVNIHAFDSPDYCITPKVSKYSELEASINKMPLKVINFNSIAEDHKIMKVLMVDEPQKLDEAYKKLPEGIFAKYSVMRSAPFFLEFLKSGSSKAQGLAFLADKLGIEQKEIIAMGDAGNDIHMIKYAGLGVAMGNAFSEVKEIADYITATNDEDGVAEVIEKFIL